MLLVDEILSLSPDEVICRKTFRADEYFFQGHYPDHPLVPGVILCECAAQTCAILLASEHVDGEQAGHRVPVLTRMNKVRFKHTLHPGDVIEIAASLQETVAGAYFLNAVIRKQGKLAASLELACTLAPAPRQPPQAAHDEPPTPPTTSSANTRALPPG